MILVRLAVVKGSTPWSIKDSVGWKGVLVLKFLVKDAYQSRTDHALEQGERIWKVIKTDDKRKAGSSTFSGDARCSFYMHTSELVSRVLRACLTACLVWSSLIKIDKLSEFLQMNFRDWIEINITDPSCFARVNIDWGLMFGAIAWNLWLERNVKVFDKLTYVLRLKNYMYEIGGVCTT
ncbi:hypothetical protein GQ457_05G020960 [Hibiscus cannabinus]